MIYSIVIFLALMVFDLPRKLSRRYIVVYVTLGGVAILLLIYAALNPYHPFLLAA